MTYDVSSGMDKASIAHLNAQGNGQQLSDYFSEFGTLSWSISQIYDAESFVMNSGSIAPIDKPISCLLCKCDAHKLNDNLGGKLYIFIG
jgi:hypothetical protein